MKKAKKVVALALCAVMLVVGSVAGTMAYLTSTTAVATNTFSVGNVTITLDEALVNNDGEAITGDGAKRVKANSYKLYPGKDYDKDPTIHVGAEDGIVSDDCWLFVKVVNEISAIEDETTIASQMTTNGWTLIDANENIYAYKETVSDGEDVIVFETFKIKGEVNNADLAAYAEKTIKVTAYAIQADGFAEAKDAWGDASKELGFNANA